MWVFFDYFELGDKVVVWVYNLFEWMIFEYGVGFVGVMFVMLNLSL